MNLKDFQEIIIIPPISKTQDGRIIGCKPLSLQTFIKITEEDEVHAFTLQFRKSSMLNYKILEDEEAITLMVALEEEDIINMLKSGEE